MPTEPSPDPSASSTETQWFCVKAQPKRENIAYGQLGTLPDIEAFFPRVRFRRAAAGKTRPVVEALFPGYLFARFTPVRSLRAVRYARGVSYIVRQGRELAPVPDSAIAALRALTVSQVLELPPQPWQLGEEVRVIAGIFQGASGRIVGLVSARQRIQVLLELLGRENRVDLPLDTLEPRHAHPLNIASS
jgi:transcriptional antiterminator RfaH